MRSKALWAVLLLALVVVNPVSVAKAAASDSSIQVGPGTIEVGANKGDTVQAQFAIANRGNKSATLSVKAGRAIISESIPKKERPRFNAAEWIDLPNSPVQIKPGKVLKYPFTVNVPTSTESGGHYATIQVNPVKPDGTSDTFVSGGVGVRVLITVAGKTAVKLSSSGFKVKGFSTSSPISIALPFLNSGDLHVVPTGEVVVKDSSDNVVARFPLNPDGQNASAPGIGVVFPHTSRTAVLRFKPPKLGHFTVSADIKYNGNQRVNIESVGFWYVPLGVIIGSIAVTVLMIGSILFFALRRKSEPDLLVLGESSPSPSDPASTPPENK